MTDDERMKNLHELAQRVTAQVIEGLKEATRCCPNCVFWLKEPEQCRNTINCPQSPGRPPADVIAFGCKQFIPDMGA